MPSRETSNSFWLSFCGQGLIFAILCFGPLAFGCVERWSIALLEIAAFLLLGVWLLGADHVKDVPSIRSAFPAFSIGLLIALLQSVNPHEPMGPRTLLPASLAIDWTRYLVLEWLALMSLLWVVAQLVTTLRRARHMAWTMLLLGGLVAFIGLIQKGQGNHAIYGLREIPYGTFSFFGPYYNRDHAGSMMVMSFLVGLGLFGARFAARRAGGIGEVADFVSVQTMIGLVLVLIAWGIVASGSRGALVCGAMGALVYGFTAAGCMADRRTAFRIRICLIMLVAGIVAAIYSDPVRFRFTAHELAYSSAFRLQLYRDGVRMFEDFPLFGSGLGTFIALYPAYQSKAIVGIAEFVHSDWLQMALELGTFATVAFFAGLAGLGIQSYRRVRRSGDLEGVSLLLGFMAAALAFILHGFFDFSFHILGNATLFFIVLACIGGCPLGGLESRGRSGFPIGRGLRGTGLALSLVLGCIAASRNYPYYVAKNAYKAGATELLAAEGASRPEPQLRAALIKSMSALRERPLDPAYRYLNGAILWRLDRIPDARVFLP